MNKRTLQVMLVLSVACVSSFAAKERVVRFQNNLRVGYDDNIYNNADKVGTSYITDIINLTGKFKFSSRSELLLYWQPEFQYRFDLEKKFVTYQDLYARLDHAISQRTFLTISDRFRYQQKEGQTGPGIDARNENFFENDLLGALSYQLGMKSNLKLGAGYLFRIWDDENYGKTQGNDFERVSGDVSLFRQFIANRTRGMIGFEYQDLEYEGTRGGYNNLAALIGVDQNFSSQVTSFARLGGSFNKVESSSSTTDTTSPYLRAGMEYRPTARTSLTGTLGYTLARSDNSFYNAQNRLSFGVGGRHDLTAKINISSSLNLVHSEYDGSHGAYGKIEDAKDDFFNFSLRCAYQINRANYVEIGYLFKKRMVDEGTIPGYDGNRVDLGWRLRL